MAIVTESKIALPEIQVGDLPGETPTWEKYTVDFLDLSDTDTSNTITLFTLPAGGVIHAARIKHSTSFTGGSLSAYVLFLGVAGDNTKYSNGATFNVFQAVGDTTFVVDDTVDSESFNATPTNILLRADSTGDNLDAATQGSVDIWVLTSQPQAAT